MPPRQSRGVSPADASPLVFHCNGIAIRRWRTAWRAACQAADVPTRFLHDCRRTAARRPQTSGATQRCLNPGCRRENWEFETHTHRGRAGAGHRPPVRRGSRSDHTDGPVRDRGTRGHVAGRGAGRWRWRLVSRRRVRRIAMICRCSRAPHDGVCPRHGRYAGAHRLLSGPRIGMRVSLPQLGPAPPAV